ncbi:MAG: serine protease [Patescibacteria group bacterium]|nr:serine protease [Patescibacteria group bacterium]
MPKNKKKKQTKKINKKNKRMMWFEALQIIRPYIFQILTPTGRGTGFQISYYPNKKLCGVATAYHVVQHAEKWGEPIELIHNDSKKKIMLQEKERVIFIHPEQDLAFILFNATADAEELPVKPDSLKLIDPEKTLKQGVELGWCGFPAIAPFGELCFFSGYVSCCVKKDDFYLVDGVAINGISGGPAFWLTFNTSELKVCGVVSAYIPNRATGEPLPGLCMVTSVEQYQKELKSLKSLDEAAEQKIEQEIKEQKNEEDKINKIDK